MDNMEIVNISYKSQKKKTKMHSEVLQMEWCEAFDFPTGISGLSM